MFTYPSRVPRPLLAATTVLFLVGAAPAAEAAWFNWGKAPAAVDEAPVVLAQADPERINRLEAPLRAGRDRRIQQFVS